MKSKLIRVLAAVLMLSMLAACGKKEVPEEEIATKEEPLVVEDVKEEPEEDKTPKKENLLTGLMEN